MDLLIGIRSPLKYDEGRKTPTLILHSETIVSRADPLRKGEQWFRALEHFGVTTEDRFSSTRNHT